MSSHHIVRDQQEPALILADVDAFPFDLLGQLLEWAPYTVCGEDALDQALKYEINLDVVFSDRPNVVEQLAHFPGVEIVPPSDNWIEEAILLLASKGHKVVNVVVGENFSDLELIHRMSGKMLVDIITPTVKYLLVKQHFSKWLTARSKMKIHGKGSFEVNGELIKSNEILLNYEGQVIITGNVPFVLGMYL